MAGRFKFSLEPVLGHRERIEDGRKREFAAAQRARFQAEDAYRQLIVRRDTIRERLQTGHNELDAVELRASYTHLDYLDRAIAAATGRVAAAVANEDRARGVLVVATQDKQVLETLKTRRREAHDSEVARATQRELDDLNARAFSRAHAKGNPPQ
jgi:flagellar export protein FliJ